MDRLNAAESLLAQHAPNALAAQGLTTPAPAARRVVALTYGTYDLFHIGHVRLFERLKARCDHLIVGVSTDEFNSIKGKRSIVSFIDRAAIVAACRYVDQVIAERGWGQKERDIQSLGVDLFAMGDDWTGRFDDLNALCEVIYLPRTGGVSSSHLKESIQTCRAAVPGTTPPT